MTSPEQFGLSLSAAHIEERQQRNGEDVREQLLNMHTRLAGLESTVKASGSVVQIRDIAAKTEELKDRLDKADEALKPPAFPNCGEIYLVTTWYSTHKTISYHP